MPELRPEELPAARIEAAAAAAIDPTDLLPPEAVFPPDATAKALADADPAPAPDPLPDPRDRPAVPPAWVTPRPEAFLGTHAPPAPAPAPAPDRPVADRIILPDDGAPGLAAPSRSALVSPGASDDPDRSPDPRSAQQAMMLGEPPTIIPTPTPRTSAGTLFVPVVPAARAGSPSTSTRPISQPPTPTPRAASPTPVPTVAPTATPAGPSPTSAPSTAARSAAPLPGGPLAWPLSGIITQPFGTTHRALDIAAPLGTPVKAAAAGTVVLAAKLTTGYGWYVIVDHGGGSTTLYAHLSAFSVAEGQRVTRGQPIGAVGQTGLATGPHVHFEVRVNGAAQDPLRYLP